MTRYSVDQIKFRYRGKKEVVCLLIERIRGDCSFFHLTQNGLDLTLESFAQQGRNPIRIYEGLERTFSTAVAVDYNRLRERKRPKTFTNLTLGDFERSVDRALLINPDS